jgi:CMP-N,N'-diacetyllegionaminic acid synthase
MDKIGYLAIIPARGGSKGVKRKNLQLCGDRPLVEWTILAAKNSSSIQNVVVSTDDSEILGVATALGLPGYKLRPAELAEDHTTTEEVMNYELQRFIARAGKPPKAIVLLQPTSPLRTREHIEAAITKYEESGADSLLSVCPSHYFFWRNGPVPEASYDYERRPRRQDIKEGDRWFRENGAIYISETTGFIRNKNRLFGKITLFLMEERDSLDIDSWEDLWSADAIMTATGFNS